MTTSDEGNRRHSAKHFAAGVPVCPSCLQRLTEAVDFCPACRFTGGDTMAMFPLSPPPLQRFFDAADLWTPGEQRKIEKQIDRLERRFPQIRWSVYSIREGEMKNLRLFGFWLMNVSPLNENESEEQRAWTILLLFNGASGGMALVPGYGAELWVSEDRWQKSMQLIADPWLEDKRYRAIQIFLEEAEDLLREAYRRVRRQLKRNG